MIFFPTLFDCVPSPEVWQTQWIERQQAKLKLEAASKEEKVFPLSPNVLLFPMVCCKCLEREKTVVPQLTYQLYVVSFFSTKSVGSSISCMLLHTTEEDLNCYI